MTDMRRDITEQYNSPEKKRENNTKSKQSHKRESKSIDRKVTLTTT